ncbi:MAG TPA: hypothetical protein VGG19_01475 [Tepidisphaeraceae bacterium]|jgi:hypothetical protein
MSEQDLRRALLRGEDQIDIQALTERVLRRDRRRMWFLGIVCFLAWMSVVMLPWSTMLPMLAKVSQYQTLLNTHPAITVAEQHEQSLRISEVVRKGTILTFLLNVGSMFVAAICTVLFIIVSRRATLRQVNARLREISLQLKNLGEIPR